MINEISLLKFMECLLFLIIWMDGKKRFHKLESSVRSEFRKVVRKNFNDYLDKKTKLTRE